MFEIIKYFLNFNNTKMVLENRSTILNINLNTEESLGQVNDIIDESEMRPNNFSNPKNYKRDSLEMNTVKTYLIHETKSETFFDYILVICIAFVIIATHVFISEMCYLVHDNFSFFMLSCFCVVPILLVFLYFEFFTDGFIKKCIFCVFLCLAYMICYWVAYSFAIDYM